MSHSVPPLVCYVSYELGTIGGSCCSLIRKIWVTNLGVCGLVCVCTAMNKFANTVPVSVIGFLGAKSHVLLDPVAVKCWVL